MEGLVRQKLHFTKVILAIVCTMDQKRLKL